MDSREGFPVKVREGEMMSKDDRCTTAAGQQPREVDLLEFPQFREFESAAKGDLALGV